MLRDPTPSAARTEPHADLREAIERFDAAGELLRIRGASWKLPSLNVLATFIAMLLSGKPLRSAALQ